MSDSLDSLDGFVAKDAWSQVENQHQEERYRRHAREARHAIVRPLPAPPVVSQTISQPDKFHCPALPARGAFEQFEERLVAEFRAFTSLGEAAEAYIRHTFKAARRCTNYESEPAWEQCFEDEACDSTQFIIADEKLKCSMQLLMNDQQQSRWKIRAKARRKRGLPAATARQMLFFVFSYHHLGQKTEGSNVLFSLMRLRDRCVSEPLKAATMLRFLHIWDTNMLEPTADAVSQRDLEKLFYGSVERCQYSEVHTEIRFYKELPESQQTQSELRRRIDKVLRKKEANDSLKAHDKILE